MENHASVKHVPEVPGEETSNAIDFRHDAQTWGTPTQEWSTSDKALWTLFIVSKQTDQKELSSGSITATFNKHFRQAKEVNRGNVYTSLGKAKLQTPSLVGEDATKTPAVWYLTSEGIKTVQKLIEGQGITIT